MAFTIKFTQINNKNNYADNPSERFIRDEATLAGKGSTAHYAKNTYGGKVNIGVHGWTSISFPTEEKMLAFTELVNKSKFAPVVTEYVESATPITDMLDRPITVGSYVVFYSNIYIVTSIPTKTRGNGIGTVRIKLADSSPSTKVVGKLSKDMCILPEADVMFWLLKKGHY